MMKKNNTSPQHIDEILASLDSIRRAEAPDFFLTRLEGRLANRSAELHGWVWFNRPVLSFATLCLLLVLNVFVISNFLQSDSRSTNNATGIEVFAEEYDLNGTSVYNEKPTP